MLRRRIDRKDEDRSIRQLLKAASASPEEQTELSSFFMTRLKQKINESRSLPAMSMGGVA